MSEHDREASDRLLQTGISVPFRLVAQEILPALDEAEFGMRLDLKFESDEENEEPEDIVEWGAFGFLFVPTTFAAAE